MGSRFVDADQLATLTGHPVRSTYKNPDDPDILPPGDVFVVAPASFNTVNKLANGISDTLGVGLVCEGMGAGRPVIVAPWTNTALANHSAYARSIQQLRDDGVHLVLTRRTEPGAPLIDPGGPFPWDDVLTEVRKLSDVSSDRASLELVEDDNHLRRAAIKTRASTKISRRGLLISSAKESVCSSPTKPRP